MALETIRSPAYDVSSSGKASPDLNSAFISETILSSRVSASNDTLSASFEGKAHKRFVIVSTLLSLIDPVRGEPTTHSLDRHPHDDLRRLEQLQKKFLDSFALICSTSRVGADTASAVCMEQGRPGGTVLRVARNCGVPCELVSKLQEVLNDLTAVALKEKTAVNVENEILIKIVNITLDKIRYLLEKICRPDIQSTVDHAFSENSGGKYVPNDYDDGNPRHWIRNLRQLVHLSLDSDPNQFITHVKWASQARWVYSEQLENVLASEDGAIPPWLIHIYKLGRYYAATKAMLKLVTTQPALFASIRVEAIKAPERVKFSLTIADETPLLSALEKITKADPHVLMAKLGQIWLTNDPEARLRKACKMTLTVHAEMQLLSFYDHNLELTPRLLFMGTSKKACYLCNEFISRHPLNIGVSASHQKLYPTWMPAPCTSVVRKRHKVLLWEFSRHLEQTTARDLETRLGVRRPFPMDSTDGPSLTSSGSVSLGYWDQEQSKDIGYIDRISLA